MRQYSADCRWMLLLFVLVFAVVALAKSRTAIAADRQPNFVIIFCDDLGYGDIGPFGSTKHRTPNLDRMAEQGREFTDFYVTSGVCSPSRSSLMTGCYPRRVGIHQNEKGQCVLFPGNHRGLNPSEITIAEVLKGKGYATAIVGKWHLGDQPEFLPTRQGFDQYFGIPFSNDMGRRHYPPLPLMRNEKVIETEPDQSQLTPRYTAEALKFIEANKGNPFFLYLPHTFPHNPIFASERFKGKSANGPFGDAVEEIDWSTGQILDKLKELGIDQHTMVVFTSDNGAASRFGGGNAPLRGFKGSTWEGGMREPCLMWWPGKIPAGTVCKELACSMDLMPTFAKLAGTSAPGDRIIDGLDIRPLIFGTPGAKTPREAFYYYQMDQLQAVRSGKWKLHLPMASKKRNWGSPEGKKPLQLFDLEADIHEDHDVSKENPEVVQRLLALAEKARADLGDAGREGKNCRKPGYVKDAKPLTR